MKPNLHLGTCSAPIEPLESRLLMSAASIGLLAEIDVRSAVVSDQAPLVHDGLDTKTAGGTNTGDRSFNIAGSTNPIATPAAAALTPTVVKSTLPASVITGAKLKARVTVSVTNGGADISVGTDTIAIYATPTAGSAPVSIGSVTKVLKIKPGRPAKASFAVDTSGLSAGTYTVAAQVTDPTGAVTAAAAGTSLTVADPFVSLTATLSTGTPASIKAGKSTNVILTLTNTGNVDSTGSAAISAGLSLHLGTISIPLTTITRTLRIKAGGKPLKVKLHLATPTTLPTGTYNAYARITQGSATASAAVADAFSIE